MGRGNRIDRSPGGGAREARLRLRHAREAAALQAVRERERAQPARERHLRAALLAAVRRDHHDTVGCLGAVNGRRGGALEDLDTGDVARVDICHPVYWIVLGHEKRGVVDISTTAGDPYV